MENIRIAYFIDHLKVGGAQRHLVEVLSRLDRRRFAPQLWTLKGEGDFIPQVERLGIPVRNFGLGRRLQSPRSLGLFRRAAQQLRADRVHIVHSYLSVANVVGTLAGALARVPLRLVSKRSLDHYPRRTEAWSQRVANRLADCVIANAIAVKQFVIEVESCPAEKIVVIPNGVARDIRINGTRDEGRAVLGFDSTDRVVGTVGRLAWKKGQEYLLKAAADVLQKEPQVTFVLVGDGPLRPQLEAQARSLGIESRVRFLGQRLDGQELIALLDVFVLPSIIEGMPNVLLEALALARPVVVTNVGGNSEIVNHQETGIVVPPRNSEDLARGILQLLRHEALAQRLGAAGQQAVHQRFSFTQTLRAMETLYEEQLQAKRVQLS